jgi:hypothetical protein
MRYFAPQPLVSQEHRPVRNRSLGSLDRERERRTGFRLRAAGIQTLGVALFQEPGHQSGRAVTIREMRRGGEDGLPGARQEGGDLLSPVRRSDRVEPSRQDQDRDVRPDRRGEVRR